VEGCGGDVPSKRSGMQGVAFEQELFFFGGCSKYLKDYHNESYLYDPVSLTWKLLKCKLSPPPRIDFGLSSLQHKRCLLFGGLESYVSYSDTHIFDLSSLSSAAALAWTEVNTKSHPTARFGHSQASFEDKVYLFGGWDGKHTLNDLWEFDSASLEWACISKHSSVSPRYRHSSVCFKNFLVVFGGVDNSQTRYNDIHTFNLSVKTWTRVIVRNDMPTPRTFHKSVVVNKHLFVVGGFDGEKLNDVWKIDLSKLCFESWDNRPTLSSHPSLPPNLLSKPADSGPASPDAPGSPGSPQAGVWRRLSDASTLKAPEERTGHSIAVYSDSLFVIGGVNSKSIWLSMGSLEVFDFKTGKWSKRQCSGDIPSIRSSMQSVRLADPSKLFLFGGYLVEEFYNDGYLLSLDSLEWKRVAAVGGEISKRAYYSMEFDGEHLYVFAGRSKSDIFDDLHRVSLSTASSRMSSEQIGSIGDRPSKRFGHTSVLVQRSM